MKKILKSLSADSNTQLTGFVNELNIQKDDIVSIVWSGNKLSLFYYSYE